MVTRALYVDGVKHVWDHHGNGATYRLNPDRPCWEQTGPGEFDIDELDAAFETDIETVAQASRSVDSLELDDSTADRLRELGYL